MGGRREDEWWITSAANDLDGWSALGLCKSLRMTLTRRRICVVVGEKISKPMRELLEESFDYVNDMHQFSGRETNNIPPTVLLPMSIWKCGFAKRAVYIHPTCLILKNCDELFQLEQPFIVSQSVGSISKSELVGSSIFVFSPSTSIFNDIVSRMREVKEMSGRKAEDTLNSYLFAQWPLAGVNKLDSEYCFVLLGDHHYDMFTLQKKVIRFMSETPWMMEFKNGRENPWSTFHSNGLLPSSKKLKDERFRKYVEHCVSEYKLPSSIAGECKPLEELLENQLDDTVSIIGMSCRFPGANNAEEFWELLVEGRDETKPMPPERTTVRRLEFGEEGFTTPVGYLKCSIQDFDAKFFEISRREAEYMDPQQRLLLEITWESLENAGINPLSLGGTNTAVFAGMWSQEYAMYLASVEQSNENFQYKYLGNSFCAASARISHFLGLRGPSTTIESGCASALQGVHHACERLRSGQTDLAISCGVNIALGVSGELKALDSFIISKDGKCKTFDESADGFARGEACVSMILKRTSDAHRDGNSILGVIRGSALNNDGGETAMGTPSTVAQELVLRAALKDSGISPSDVSYIEAHGTGTPVGDPTEFHALSKVFENRRVQPLIVGSVKTNIGHTEGSSGMAGLVKVLLCMKNRMIPRHLHFKTLNPYINIDDIPAVIPLENTSWTPTSTHGLIAGVSSFGLSGTNVNVILQEPPNLSTTKIEPSNFERTNHIFTLSAKSEKALEEITKSYIGLIEAHPGIQLADLAFSANTGRAHLRHRLGFVAQDTEQLLNRLRKGVCESGTTTAKKKKVAFLFTGQGSQYVEMANTLFLTHPNFRESLNICEGMLRENYGIDLYKILQYTKSDSRFDGNYDLNSSIFSQPSIFCIEVCLAQLWKSFGIFPDIVLGHSVGEFAAAVAAGIITLDDGLKLVVERSRLVNTLEGGSMAVVRSSHAVTLELIAEFSKKYDSWVDIAAVNSENEIVVSGRQIAVEHFSDFCRENLINTQLLLASHAFHSRDMDLVLQDYETVTRTVANGQSKCKYISGTLAKQVVSTDFTPTYWAKHLREPVNFQGAFNELIRDNDDVAFVEIGPQPVLLALGMACVPPENTSDCIYCPTIRKGEDNWSTMLKSMQKMYTSGVGIDWLGFDSAYRRQKIALPNYPFQREQFWFDAKAQNNESLSVNSMLIHPILGRRVPSPVAEKIIYHNSFSLDTLPYVRDHVVANKIILPGAGYLEAILAAGRDIICGGTHASIALHVEDFAIESALILEEEQFVQIQTVVSSRADEDQLKYTVEIFKQIVFDPSGSDGGKWKRLASATFIPSASIDDSKTVTIDLSALQSKLTLRETADDIYKKIADTGINFGRSFKSIEKFWYSDDELLAQTSYPAKTGKYVCHPVVLDAMIQTCVASLSISEKNLMGLYLPMFIGKFISFPNKANSSKLYIYSRRQSQEFTKQYVTLFTDGGQQIASMEGLDMIQTTVPAFLRITNSEVEKYPSFYEEIWQRHLGPCVKRVELVSDVDMSDTEEIRAFRRAQADDVVVYDELVKRITELPYRYILKAFVGMGWNYMPGDTVFLNELAYNSGVQPKHIKLLSRWLHILEEEGDLRVVDDAKGEFLVCKELPCSETIESGIEDMLADLARKRLDDVEVRFAQVCGEKLESLMKGKISVYSVLYPDAAASLYRSDFITLIHEIPKLVVRKYLETGEVNKEDVTIRVIEVGAGTGSQTEVLVCQLKELGLKYEYMFTDVSPLFLNEAAKRFAGNKNIKYKLLDLEKDPLVQGFSIHYYDILVADSVIHATENVRVTLGHVITLLRPGALFFFTEQVYPFRIMDISFGFMEGWWRFNDFDVRKDSPILNKETWLNVLRSLGFGNLKMLGEEGGIGFPYRAFVATSPPIVEQEKTNLVPNDSRLWLIFGEEDDFSNHIGQKLAKVGRRCYFVEFVSALKSNLTEENFRVNPLVPEHFQKLFGAFTERKMELEGIIFLNGMFSSRSSLAETDDLDKLCEMNFALLHLLQAIVVHESKPKIFVVTKGAQFVEEQEPSHPIAATLWGMLMCFNNEHAMTRNVLIDLDPEEQLATSAADLFYLLWQNDAEFQIALRGRNLYYKRLLLVKPYNRSLIFPNTDRYKLQNPPTGLFSDLAITAAVRQELGPRDVEVKMICTSLNFKDVIMTLVTEGMNAMPSTQTARNATEIGLDICGVVVSVGAKVKQFDIGDEVVGSCAGGALASHVVVQEKMLTRKSENCSMEESALSSVIFTTANYFLLEVGELKKQDKVLIHTAAGGVGLAAILVAKEVGAELYVTAGSRRKRHYLRSLGIKNVYNSRNTNFANEIQHATNGSGVDVVLNSITGPGFKEATLSVCAHKARFLEMSKFNVWTIEDVAALRPDVFYFIQELKPVTNSNQLDDGGAFGDEKVFTNLRERYISQAKSGKFKHIPFTMFPMSRCEDAFQYLQDTKQIGKVVIKIPETSVVNGSVIHKENFFSPCYTYLITGGMGGIGLEVAKWMAGSGAQYLVLVGRSPPSARAEAIISGIRGTKVNVLVLQADVSEYSQCERILKEINDLYPPLKGIMHAAGVTSDNAFGDQNMESLMMAYKPKIHGTMNLHVLTKSFNLDHFVLFSSAISTVGGLGQCNHAAANKYLDAFAQYRVESGMPCCSVNWGPWSDVGAAMNIENSEAAFGIKMFTPDQGIAALERALFAHRTNTVVFDITEQRTIEQTYNLGNFFEFIKQKQSEMTGLKEYESKIKAITEAEPHERREMVREFIEFCLREVLKLGEDDQMDPDQDFREMGVDSLMGMEIRSRMQPLLTAFDTKSISLTEVQENRTINKMTNLICNAINKISLSKVLSPEELLSLAALDSNLGEDIVPIENSPPDREINSVLLTGVTGLLGPHVLRELFRQREGLKITCLVRAKSNEEAKNRLDDALKQILADRAVIENVVCIAADIANRKFGLGDDEYEELANTVDAVMNLAVSSNHLLPYGQYGEGDLRSTNVLALKHVLKFATAGKTKRIFFPGNIYSITTRNPDGSFPDEFPADDDHGMSCHSAYLQSKLICEKLLKQAIIRGLHVIVLRQHHLLGDSRTGVMDVRRNYTGMVLSVCGKIGKFPKVTNRYLTGVAADVAANISVQMLLTPGVEPGVYNVNNPKACLVTEMQVIFERRGVKVDLVPYNEWKEAAILHFGGFDLVGAELSQNMDNFLPEYLRESESPDAYRILFANSSKIKKLIPNIDDLMVQPIKLAEVHLDHYEGAMGSLAQKE